ncbi:hypothetical protein PINS_up022909 [Pythium insidiosum]|nr:hypothetical protein PINS_up022909 [Pythium insidiosum]
MPSFVEHRQPDQQLLLSPGSDAPNACAALPVSSQSRWLMRDLTTDWEQTTPNKKSQEHAPPRFSPDSPEDRLGFDGSKVFSIVRGRRDDQRSMRLEPESRSTIEHQREALSVDAGRSFCSAQLTNPLALPAIPTTSSSPNEPFVPNTRDKGRRSSTCWNGSSAGGAEATMSSSTTTNEQFALIPRDVTSRSRLDGYSALAPLTELERRPSPPASSSQESLVLPPPVGWQRQTLCRLQELREKRTYRAVCPWKCRRHSSHHSTQARCLQCGKR